MIVAATFTEIDDNRTEVRIQQTNVPEPLRRPAAQAGFLTSLDRFGDHLAQLAGEGAE
jgi:hypothetical protein